MPVCDRKRLYILNYSVVYIFRFFMATELSVGLFLEIKTNV